MRTPAIPRIYTVPLLIALLLLKGTTVSTLYCAQSVAGLLRSDLGASLWISLMPSAALVGYAIGVAILAAVARDLTAASGIGLHALVLGVGLSAAAGSVAIFGAGKLRRRLGERFRHAASNSNRLLTS